MANEIVPNAAQRALTLFRQGSACSQAVLCAFASSVGLDERMAHRLATGFGAGMGRKQYVCGAISGGVAVLSLHFGNSDPSQTKTKERTYSVVRELIEAAEAELGSSSCLQLLGVEIQSDAGRAEAKRRGLFDTVCERCVLTVARLVENALAAASTD